MAPSFRSAASGVVLGSVGCKPPGCRVRPVAMADGGARWHFVTAPDVCLLNPAGSQRSQAARVSGAVFASRRDCWLYSKSLQMAA
jgi:hypothetical protein